MGAETAFGPFSFDAGSNMLLRQGKPVAIGQRGLALLRALLDADGAVPKAALMEAGWPGTFVEESNLTVQIAALRKALGPGVHVFRAIHLTRAVDLRIRRQSLFDETAHLLFISRVLFNSLDDQAVNGPVGLLRDTSQAGAKLGWKADGGGFGHGTNVAQRCRRSQ